MKRLILAAAVAALLPIGAYAQSDADLSKGDTNTKDIFYGGGYSQNRYSPLDKINNISYDQTVAGRLFNYGHVEIQTAAEAGATDYYNVNHPKRLKDTITAAQSEYKNWQFSNQATQMAAAMDARGSAAAKAAGAPAIAQELERLFELKMKGALSEEEYNRAKARLLNH